MAMELDPQFIKALKLLRSKSKDSGVQLKAMLDEAIRLKKGLISGSSSSSNITKQSTGKFSQQRLLCDEKDLLRRSISV